MVGRSALYTHIYNLISSRRRKTGFINEQLYRAGRVGKREGLATIERMHRLCRLHGVQCLVVMIPHKSELHDSEDLDDDDVDDDLPHYGRALEGLHQIGIPSLDPLPVFRSEFRRGHELYLADGHWNVRAHSIVATLIAERIAETDGPP